MRKISLIVFFLVCVLTMHSQDVSDTLQYTPIKDSLSKTVDTLTASNGAIDAIVEYSAKDSAVFDIKGKQLLLYNDGELKYKEYNLKAARVVLYQDDATMDAYGIPDTTIVGKYIGLPIFYEGIKRYDASRIKYNFQTRKGNITMGTTELEGGYYLGEKIKKVSDDIYFVENGRYTTSDKADPDYYFGSPMMKVIQGNQVIASPVYLYVDDVPIFWLPFGIFPNHSGRSSGLIPPAYGDDATYGRYLSHLGYYWAMNDYMDLTFQGNYFTAGRLDLSGRYRYASRYKFTGELNLGGSRIRIGEPGDLDKNFSDQWNIALNHNQTVDPTTTISANLNFVSSKFYYDNTTNNLSQLLRQNAISNFTINKFWEGSPYSVSLNYFRDQNLTTGEIRENLPSINFTRSQTFPLRGRNTSLLDLKWYENISFAYNAQLLNTRTKTLFTDSQGIQDGSFVKDSHAGVRQNVNLTAPIRFGEFTFSPFFNYAETWYNKSITKTFNPADSVLTTNPVSGFKAFRNFNTGVTLNTRLVGLFNTKIFGLKGFRHTVTPSVTYNFTPDFSKPQWNIYGTYFDASGREIKYSFFEREVFGYPGTGEQQALSFGMGNLFEIKVKDTDSTDAKYQLLNLNAGINYNFAADSIKFSELGIDYRTQIGNFLNIGGSARFNLYKYVDGVGRINQFLWKTDRKFANLTNFNINLSTTLAGSEEINPDADTTKRERQKEDYIGIYDEEPVDYTLPWSVSLNYNYTIDKQNPSVITKFSNISGSLAFNLTKKWKFNFTTGYDIFVKQFTAPYVTIYRDLDSWEMSFNWIPIGAYRGYKFEVRIKAPQLQDVKVTRQTNFRGVFQ